MTQANGALVALSLTEADEGLLRYAAMIAQCGECTAFRFVHVVTPHHAGAEPFNEQQYLDELQKKVALHFDALPSKPALSYHVVQGPRIDQLLGVAVEQRVDVILLGHRKLDSGRRSLARRLALVAPCSVWMVPDNSLNQIRKILVPIDFSTHSADALSKATALSQLCGLSECLALHVFFDDSTVRYEEHVEMVRGQEQAAFEKFIANVDLHGVHVEPIFEESSHPAQAILRNAEQHGVDLIVMNTRGRTLAAAVLLGSITSQTMIETRIPLLAVKHFGGRMTLLDALMHHRFWEKKVPKTS